MAKTVYVTLTSAIAVDGELVKAGETIGCTEKNARNLMRRGKAVLADEKPADESDLSELTVAELRELAEDAGITGYSDMRKAELIAALEAAE